MDRWRWLGEEDVWLCSRAWRHIYRTRYCGQFRTRPGPQLLLAGKPQDWNIRLGHWRLRPQQRRLMLRCPSLGLQSESVTSCEWLFQIILISFLLPSHHTVWLESVLILCVSSHHLEPGVSVVFLAVHRNPASCVLTLLQALWDSRAADPSPVPCCMMVTSWSVMASLPHWFSVFEVCAYVLYRIKHLGLLGLSSFFQPDSDLNKQCRQEHLVGFVGWFLKYHLPWDWS